MGLSDPPLSCVTGGTSPDRLTHLRDTAIQTHYVHLIASEITVMKKNSCPDVCSDYDEVIRCEDALTGTRCAGKGALTMFRCAGKGALVDRQ